MKETFKNLAESSINSIEGTIANMFKSLDTKESIQDFFNKLREVIGVKTKKDLTNLKEDIINEQSEGAPKGAEESTLIFGDSIGVGLSVASKKYGRLFEKYVKSGASSAKIHSFLKNFKDDLSGKSLVFMSGFNDLPSGEKGADRALRNMTKNIALAKKKGGKPVVCGLYHTEYDRIKNEDIDYYNENLKRICKRENVEFVELDKHLAGQKLPDGLHLNSRGYDKAWDKIRKYI